MTQPDATELLHELHVHQAELEAQNRELRESREALEASRARYADLFDFAPIGYMTLDPSARILDVNLTGASLLGYERSRVLGKPLRVLVQLDEPDAMSDHVRACISGRRSVKTELAFGRRVDESHVWVQAISLPVVAHDGTVSSCRTALVDVSELKAAERERERALVRERAVRENLERARVCAEEASRAKDEFLSIVSHELRTPLNAILGWSHMLSTRFPEDPEKVRRGLGVILNNAQVQARLVDDILDVSRIVTGKLRLKLEPARLAGIVDAAVESLLPTAWAKRITLTLRTHADVSVMADSERLLQATWNLLSNALKFTPPGGHVDVLVDAHEDRAIVEVRDDGSGIDREALSWIFERFRQADASPSRVHGGLGLGLAIVRYIVELHGGRVRGESAGKGCGATFTIELPKEPAAVPDWVSRPAPTASVGAREEARTQAPAQRLAGVPVLVVDDNEDARVLGAAILEAEGAVVAVAASSDEAFTVLERAVPRVLVSDLAMPGGDGLTLIRRVRTLPPPVGCTPAVAVTAYAREEDVNVARAAGYDDHIAKPVSPYALVEAVARLAKR